MRCMCTSTLVPPSWSGNADLSCSLVHYLLVTVCPHLLHCRGLKMCQSNLSNEVSFHFHTGYFIRVMCKQFILMWLLQSEYSQLVTWSLCHSQIYEEWQWYRFICNIWTLQLTCDELTMWRVDHVTSWLIPLQNVLMLISNILKRHNPYELQTADIYTNTNHIGNNISLPICFVHDKIWTN